MSHGTAMPARLILSSISVRISFYSQFVMTAMVFIVDQPRKQGMGLHSMQERAELIFR